MVKDFILRHKYLLILTSATFGLWVAVLFFDTRYFVVDNNANFFLPSYIHNWRSLIDYQQIPFVNYYQYLGNRHLAQGQTGVFYPVIYISSVLSQALHGNLYRTIDYLFLIHLLIASVGMYFLLQINLVKQFKSKENRSLIKISSILWSLSYISLPSVLGISRNWVVVIYLVAFLPWIFYLWTQWLNSSKIKYLIALMGIKILLVLQGYIQWVPITGVFELIWLLIVSKTSSNEIDFFKKNIFIFGFTWILTALLTAFQLLPLYQHSQESIGRSSKFTSEQMMEFTVMPIDWIKAQVFIFKDEVLFEGSNYIYYFGVIWLAWIFISYTKNRFNSKGTQKVYFILFICSLISISPLYQVAYFVPILNWFRWPFKHLVFVSFFGIMYLGTVINQKTLKNKILLFGIPLLGIATNLFVLFKHSSTEYSFSPEKLPSQIDISWPGLIKDNYRLVQIGEDLNDVNNPFKYALYGHQTTLCLSSFSGYDATLSKDLWETTRGVTSFGIPSDKIENNSLIYLKSWSVKYLLTSSESVANYLVDAYSLEKINQTDNVYVLEIPDTESIVNTSASDYVIETNQIVVNKIETKEPIQFNIYGWSQYKAYDQNNELLPIQYIDKRPVVSLKEDTKSLSLRYVDNEFLNGLKISCATLVGVVLIFAFNYRKRKV